MAGFRKNVGFLAIGAAMALLGGCGDSNKGSGGVNALEHETGWTSSHGDVLVAGETDCATCHGIALDGGSAGVACADCHGSSAAAFAANPDLAALVFSDNNGTPLIEHPSGWESSTVTDDTIPFYTFDAARHGYVAKQYGKDVPVGFAFCAGCHTDSFTGQDLPTPPFPGPSANCLACHGNDTPHSPDLGEWDQYHHITTDPHNATVCALCHANGQNSPLPPPEPDPSVANNCFNGTLCHTNSIVTTPIVEHFNNHWIFHQRSPEACRICHGDDFQGRGEAPACFSCHNGNTAPMCTTCHDPGTISPPGNGGSAIIRKSKKIRK